MAIDGKRRRAVIRNIVFDFGNVLIHYEPLYMAGMYAHTEEDARLLAEVVFDRLYWHPRGD